MFIIVKYGNNETLLCNPSCAVINLLTSIKRRAGYGNSNVIVDLSDETGLVKELDTHKYDYANKYVESHATYILVQKEPVPDNESIADSGSTPTPTVYQYTPLLEQYADLFPNYQLRVDHIEKKPTRKRTGGKSPSPAGRFQRTKDKKSDSAATKKGAKRK
ncbi:hypothetical protein KUTeg_013481 [Tegillarca granosa]|uniref:Uncharacterized protein n=1 Tax=Tegillarca granosa TaxID=220873 RepID=A0ABQ9EYB7_TEGGR|nr:hypothetical protein KUTeg_013481 [Tegillarca granosa]